MTTIQLEYTATISGKQFSLYWLGGLTWTAWLEGTGNVAVGWDAPTTLALANAKLGTHLTADDLQEIRPNDSLVA